MLSRITGVLERLELHVATIAPPTPGWSAVASAAEPAGPLAYDVHVPAFLAEDLAERIGDRVTLHTVQVFEGASQGGNLTPRLLGFASRDDRAFFELFTTVKGVGARKALRAMAVPPGHIAHAIAEQNAAALKALPEVGTRLAATIIAELAGKAERFAAAPIDAPDPRRSVVDRGGDPEMPEPARQAVEALVRLGTPRQEAERRVARAIERDPTGVANQATDKGRISPARAAKAVFIRHDGPADQAVRRIDHA